MELKTVLIAAIGGQGGNILSEWIFAAAHLAGHLAQSVGLPGLAQRGGATSNYVEIAVSHDRGRRPPNVVFCQMPVQGQVDVLVAQELLEMGHMLERGYASAGATVVTSTHRDYTVMEKMPMGEAVADSELLLEAGRQLARQFVPIDVPGLVRAQQLNPLAGNAVLLGALAATEALPMTAEHYREAIRRVGLAAGSNLEAFEAGLAYVRTGGHRPARQALAAEADPAGQRAALLPARYRQAYHELVGALDGRYGSALGRTLVEAVYQLIDYQDPDHARQYLDLVADMWQREQQALAGGDGVDREPAQARPPAEPVVTHAFARNLASLMTYEDAIRVAEFKTGRQRFQRIRKEHGVEPDQVYRVVDYLKPDAEEIYGLFPAGLVDSILPALERLGFIHKKSGEARYLEQKPRTTTLPGFLTFRFLTWFKPLRSRSWRGRLERDFQEAYVGYVREYLSLDRELAALVARTGQMVRGYGAVRRRTFAAVRYLCGEVLPALAAREQQSGRTDLRLTRTVARVAMDTLLTDEHGTDLMRTLLERVQARYDSMPYERLIDEVTRAGKTLRQPIALTVREDAIPLHEGAA